MDRFLEIMKIELPDNVLHINNITGNTHFKKPWHQSPSEYQSDLFNCHNTGCIAYGNGINISLNKDYKGINQPGFIARVVINTEGKVIIDLGDDMKIDNLRFLIDTIPGIWSWGDWIIAEQDHLASKICETLRIDIRKPDDCSRTFWGYRKHDEIMSKYNLLLIHQELENSINNGINLLDSVQIRLNKTMMEFDYDKILKTMDDVLQYSEMSKRIQQSKQKELEETDSNISEELDKIYLKNKQKWTELFNLK